MKANPNVVLGPRAKATIFSRSEGNVLRLKRLCGMTTADQTGIPGVDGPSVLQVNSRRFEGAALVLESERETESAFEVSRRVGDTSLRLKTVWTACPETGILSRRDTLANTGDEPMVISRCLARAAFPSGRYEWYTQASRWCRENQGAWHPLHTGLRLTHLPGRTTEGATPYLVFRSVESGQGLAFHVLPQGNWVIRVRPHPAAGDAPLAVIELGLADEDLNMILRPGTSLNLPEILIQAVPQGLPHLAAPALHRYLLMHHFAEAKPEAPVVYNTWFDQFDALDVPRLRRQVSAAKEVGCEVFVIDAGWYGAGGPDWAAQTGDWREKTEAAFRGRMQEFAEEVRAAGLGFGLWMEPERFGSQAPVRSQHPDWFTPVGSSARIDLTRPDAYAWLRGEMARLIETYDLAWMKIDFNFALGDDASGTELYDYTRAWYRLLDDIRTAYPHTFFEGCASGALRTELAMLRHVDGHFLSDSVNPTDMVRISQGAFLRLPPGRLTRWTVVRSAGRAVPRYGKSVADSPPVTLTPKGAIWEPSETVDLNYSLCAALPGMFGLGGDLAGLEPEQRSAIAAAVAFYKRWRSFITGGVVHLLTPPEPVDHRVGWIAFQIQSPDEDTSLVFVYALGWAGSPPPIRLRGLDAGARYRLDHGFDETEVSGEISGAELMADGLRPSLVASPIAPENRGEVFVIRV